MRAFAVAQVLLNVGAPEPTTIHDVGWHGTSVEPHNGCTAVVSQDLAEELTGAILKVTWGGRSALVYVMGGRNVPVKVSLARSVFGRIAPLWREKITARVEVLK